MRELRRGLVVVFAALAAAACGRETPPNLLLITVDTLRADRLACYGGPPDSGAALCRIFEAGTRYAWAFTPAPYTAPAVASLLTSLYPAYHGVTQNVASYLGAEQQSVAELLAAAGYTTAAFVSNPVLDRGRNFGQGFALYDQQMTRRERNRSNYVERNAAATTDAVLAWANSQRAEPWFVWVHYQDPHGPYEPPGAPAGADQPGATRLPVLADQSGHAGIPAYQALPGLYTLPAYEHRYRDEIAYLAPQIERLVEALDALGRPPAILLTADHGEAFGEDDYYFAHGHSLGLDQIRVPLLFRPAHGKPPARLDAPVSLIDIAPTLLSLAGVAAPAAFQGRALPGSDATSPRSIYAEHDRQAAVVANGRFYARDRLQDDAAHHLELGEDFPWLPPRTATLGADGPNPAYQPADAAGRDADLEASLSEFLAQTRGRKGVVHDQVDAVLRERMRALGYVED